MMQEAEKTIVAKIRTDELTQTKRESLDYEFSEFQAYIRCDDDADLYSTTKQAADAYIDTEKLRDDECPWFIRNDVFDVEQHDTELADWWLNVPVSQVYGGVNVPINPHESIPDDAEVKDSKIVKEDGEYYAHLSIKQRVELQDEYDGVLAVDLGSRWVSVSVALPSRETTFYGEEIRQLRRHHQELRTRFQEKGAYDTLVSAKDSEWRAIDDRLHKIGRQIVEDAKERNALIVIGNLDGIQNQDKGSEMNRRLHSMPHTLKQYIKYKARFAGIGVKVVNEYNTSQTCWRCGEKEDTERVGHGRHLCDGCELDDNADKNGATNIGKKGLGKDIQSPLSSLGGVYEPSLELGDDDETSAQVRVRLRDDSETPPSTSESAGRAK